MAQEPMSRREFMRAAVLPARRSEGRTSGDITVPRGSVSALACRVPRSAYRHSRPNRRWQQGSGALNRHRSPSERLGRDRANRAADLVRRHLAHADRKRQGRRGVGQPGHAWHCAAAWSDSEDVAPRSSWTFLVIPAILIVLACRLVIPRLHFVSLGMT